MRILPITCSLILALLLGSVVGCAGKKGGSTVDSQLSFGSKMAQRGLWSEAYFRFEQATKVDPQDHKAWNNLAVACEAMGEFEEALGYYRKGLELNPQSKTLRRNYDRFSGFYSAFKAAQERDRQKREEVAAGSADEEALSEDGGDVSEDGADVSEDGADVSEDGGDVSEDGGDESAGTEADS